MLAISLLDKGAAAGHLGNQVELGLCHLRGFMPEQKLVGPGPGTRSGVGRGRQEVYVSRCRGPGLIASGSWKQIMIDISGTRLVSKA